MGVFAYYDTDTDGIVYHVIPSPQSEYAPSTIYSETDSMLSGTTIQSDDLPGYFVVHHGRQHPASDNVAKWVPSDNIRRHVIRYLLAKSMVGGNCTEQVKKMIAPVEGRKRRVVQVGTRTGAWVQAMATEFPDVEFYTVDVVPMIPHVPRPNVVFQTEIKYRVQAMATEFPDVEFYTVDVVPMIPHVPRPNVVFQVYDFTKGLLLEDESQDVVYLACLLEMVRDYRSVVREAHRVLRPGGLLFTNDPTLGFWDPEDIRMLSRRNPQACRLYRIIRERVSKFGIDPDMFDKLPQWLTPGSDLWDKGQSGFKDIQCDIRIQPWFPHEGQPCMDLIDTSMAPYARHVATSAIRDATGVAKTLV
ncbi:methyltransferase domain protein [Ceratobasidium sp. AG-Ba]|nr:methyltransferase domain protein [Ceratobasidium sp. AG-Ba]